MASNGSSHTPLSAAVQEQGMAVYAAKSLFQPYNTRQAIRDAHDKKIPPLLGVYYGVSSIPTCRLLAPIGFDTVWIDWEHSACNIETMTTVGRATASSPEKRIPTDPDLYMVHDTMFMSQGRTIPWVR